MKYELAMLNTGSSMTFRSALTDIMAVFNSRLASQHFSHGKKTGQTPCRDLCCTVNISDKILSGCGFRDVSLLHGILRFS